MRDGESWIPDPRLNNRDKLVRNDKMQKNSPDGEFLLLNNNYSFVSDADSSFLSLSASPTTSVSATAVSRGSSSF